MKGTKIVLSMLTLFFAGCAYMPQQATITPNLHLIDSNIGKGLKVTVIVKDERPSKSLGFRRGGYGRGAEITTTQNIEELVKREILNGLKKKGFDTTEYNEKHDRELIAELRLLEYTTSTGLMSGGIHVKGALKAICKNEGMEYEEMYRFESEKRVIIVPTAEENERLITAGMSNLLEEFFSDEKLFEFLAAKAEAESKEEIQYGADPKVKSEEKEVKVEEKAEEKTELQNPVKSRISF